MDTNILRLLDEHLAVTDQEFDKVREFVVGDSGDIARLKMGRLAVSPSITKFKTYIK